MLKLCYLLFVASLAASGKLPIDDETLQNVFGYPQSSFQSPSMSAPPQPFYQQAIPVTPVNGTLVDPEYWDAEDNFVPSTVDYDTFDWAVTRRLAETSRDNNFLLSPVGLKMALAILTEAASGPTQAELQNVLGFDRDRHVTRRKFASIIQSLVSKSSDYILNFGSRIYVGDVTPRQKFAGIAQDFYSTEIKRIDFDKTAAATKEINTWVSDLTRGKINNLVNEGDLAGVMVVIVNALYFQGTWIHQFLPNMTNLGTFYVSPKVHKTIDFMNIKNAYHFTESKKLDAKILRMPYMGYKYSMYFVVPNSITGLQRIFNGLSELKNEMASLKQVTVEVSIPKWTFDFETLLDGILKDMGIRQVFEDTASLPGISRGQSLRQRLKVSKILQRTGIEVNELGTSAYAATEILLENKFGDDEDAKKSEIFVANKPFLFFIEDETTRQLLFAGRLTDPTSKGGEFKH